jgi:pimeloyl-ACP methyl ester carboxylesterase
MNLSLEVKKFINNEHTGDYVTVVLPSELPVERSEVREVNRDRSAAHSAKNLADNKARIAQKARDRVKNTEKLHSLKQEELDEANAILDDIVSQQKAMQPELNEKREIFEEAEADYDEKNAAYLLKRESFEAMERAYNAAVDAERAANLVLNDCRANYSGAENALASAKEQGLRHEGKLSSTRSEVAESKVLSENAAVEAREASRLEAEKTVQFNSLSQETAQKLAVFKRENKRLSDAQRALNSALKECNRSKTELASVKEALAAAEDLANDPSKADNDSVKAKAASLRARLSNAEIRVDTAESDRVAAEKNLSSAQESNAAAEMEYNKIFELMSACRKELDDLREKSSAASSRAAEAEAKYSSFSSSFEKSQNDLASSERDVKSFESELISSKKALLNAETDVAKRHDDVTDTRNEREKARAVRDEKRAVMQQSEAKYNTLKSSYNNINNSYQMAERDRKTQKNICERLKTERKILSTQREDNIASRDAAEEDAEMSASEAERRRLSVRTINTKNETAKIHFMQQGKGEDLILIHSIGQSLYTYRELISKLSSKFRVTALDLVGFGYSQKPYYFNYTLDEMSDFIARFMDAMEMETAHLFGFSMGAGYVINFAKRYPDRVGKIVLLSPGGLTPEMPSSIRSIEGRIFGGLSVRMINLKSVKKMLSECYFDLTNHTDEVIEEYYKPIANPETKRVIRACIMNYDDEEVIHSLRDVNADTLILWGNEDKWHPVEMSNMFKAVMPKVNFTLVRNAGHLAHEEKAERVAQLIKMFIPCGYEDDETENF